MNEDLAENIWEAKHMDKIVASLLFNLNVNEMRISLVGIGSDSVARARAT